MGEDIVISEPNVSSEVEKGLNECEFLVCQEIFHNLTTQFADVVLPAACFAEKDGVFTNSDRRVQRVRKAVDPPGEAREDWEILCDLAGPRATRHARLRRPRRDLRRDGVAGAEVRRHLPRATRRAAAGAAVALSRPDHEGTPTLHEGGPIIGKAPSSRSSLPAERRAARRGVPAGALDGPDPLPLQRGDPDPARSRSGGQAEPRTSSRCTGRDARSGWACEHGSSACAMVSRRGQRRGRGSGSRPGFGAAASGCRCTSPSRGRTC